MKFVCALYVVEDIDKSRVFYEKMLDQKVLYDFGENVTFEGDFSIHKASHFADMVSVQSSNTLPKSNDAELCFETEDLVAFIDKLDKSEYEIEYLHDLREHPWGQRVIRFYDFDKHIVEVGESMDTVIKRYFDEGKTLEEVAMKTQYPVSYVEQITKNRE